MQRPFSAWPSFAAWEHQGARRGFEVAFLRAGPEGLQVVGHTSAVEDDVAWSIRYRLELDADERCRRASIEVDAASGTARRELESDGAGRWTVDGSHVAALDGLLDLDLACSVLTNAFAVRRLALDVDQAADAPAVYVCAPDLHVDRIEQRYGRLADDGDVLRFTYDAPSLDVHITTRHDGAGLVLDYPGLAIRVR